MLPLNIITMTENELATLIVQSAFKVRKDLGMGLLEGAYEKALKHELESLGLVVSDQQAIPVIYDGQQVESGFRADLIVNDCVAIELKTVSTITPVHKAQLLTYLHFLHLKLGLIINFNSYNLRDGIRRVANGL